MPSTAPSEGDAIRLLGKEQVITRNQVTAVLNAHNMVPGNDQVPLDCRDYSICYSEETLTQASQRASVNGASIRLIYVPDSLLDFLRSLHKIEHKESVKRDPQDKVRPILPTTWKTGGRGGYYLVDLHSQYSSDQNWEQQEVEIRRSLRTVYRTPEILLLLTIAFDNRVHQRQPDFLRYWGSLCRIEDHQDYRAVLEVCPDKFMKDDILNNLFCYYLRFAKIQERLYSKEVGVSVTWDYDQ